MPTKMPNINDVPQIEVKEINQYVHRAKNANYTILDAKGKKIWDYKFIIRNPV